MPTRTDEHTDAYLAERVRSELARVVHELGITVVVRSASGRAELSGSVATAQRRAEVERVARAVLPAFELHNRVTVPAMDAPAREELA